MTDVPQEPAKAANAEEPKRSARRSLIVGLVVLVAAGAGVGAYFVGKSGGEDLDAARAAGETQGQREGAAKGAAKGYDEGFKEGRRKGYEATYSKTYQRAFKAAFKKAGLDPPSKRESLPPKKKAEAPQDSGSSGSGNGDAPEIKKSP